MSKKQPLSFQQGALRTFLAVVASGLAIFSYDNIGQAREDHDNAQWTTENTKMWNDSDKYEFLHAKSNMLSRQSALAICQLPQDMFDLDKPKFAKFSAYIVQDKDGTIHLKNKSGKQELQAISDYTDAVNDVYFAAIKQSGCKINDY